MTWLNVRRLGFLIPLVLLSDSSVIATPFEVHHTPFPGKIINKTEGLLDSYDYIVVGGGTSGLVVASRLTENPKTTVLVIEAGKFGDESECYLVPRNLFCAGVGNMWPLIGAPMPELMNRTAVPNSARIVGGGSQVNGMLFDRGAPGDYDLWGELIGDKSWGWKGLLPYFRKSETFTPPTKEQQETLGITFDMSVHGVRGPIQNSFPPWIYDHHRDLIVAGGEVGLPVPKDGSGNAIGAFWVPNSIDPVRRERSYARNYHKLAVNRPNYHIMTETMVTKVIFNKKRTINGVEFVPYTDPTVTEMPVDILKTQVLAKKEVIMAAGSVHTPRILQLSGIGPRPLLDRVGIKQTINLPGVGENFQDHQGAFSTWNTTFDRPEMDPSYLSVNQTYRDLMYQQYLQNRTGPFTVSSGNALIFVTADHINLATEVLKRAEEEDPRKYLLPDVDASVVRGYKKAKTLMVKHFRRGTMAVQETTSGGTGLGGGLAHPFSRGRISIASKDPFQMPTVDWRPFTNPADMKILVAALRWQNEILANAPVHQKKNVIPVVPPADATDLEIEAFIRGNGVPSWAHLTCSCPMLKLEDGGCVDSKLRVYGSKGKLRIVDASMMPVVPGTHTQSTVYAVAEKAADIIKSIV